MSRRRRRLSIRCSLIDSVDRRHSKSNSPFIVNYRQRSNVYLQVLCTCVASLSLQRVELLFDFEVDNWLVRFLKHNILLGRGSLVGGWRSHRSFASYLRNELYIINEMSFFFLFLFQLYFWTRLPRLRWNGHDIRLVRKQLRLG